MFTKIITGECTGIIHKITHPTSGQSLYPDILIAHPFKELAIKDDALYEEANTLMKQYGPSGCLFLCSTDADWTRVQEFANSLTAGSDTKQEESLTSQPSRGNASGNFAPSQSIEQMANDLQLSHTMRLGFYQMMQYYQEIGGNPEDVFTPFREEYALPVKTKNEGKLLYERIRNTILG